MKKKVLFWTASLLLVASAAIYAQDRNGWLGHMFFTQSSPEIRFNGTLKFQTSSGSNLLQISQTAQTPALTFGTAGSQLTQARSYRQAFTPVANSAFQSWVTGSAWSQTFTVSGLSVLDYVMVNGPAPTAYCPPVGWKVSATDTLTGYFATTSNAACTPAAGIYTIWAFRT